MKKLVSVLVSCSLSLAVAICLITVSSPNPSLFALPQKLYQQYQSNVSNKPLTEDECDLFKGHWVRDTNGSSYSSTNCQWIPERKNCFKHGRTDLDFLNWRWKPDGCELPRFDPKTFLNIVQGKRMVFIGDSVARNQMDSLLCLLSQEVVPIEIHNKGEDNERIMSFPTYNFTVQSMSALFLVKGENTVNGGKWSFDTVFRLYLDKVDGRWAEHLHEMDYAIISDGPWFFRTHYLYENDTLIGCTKCKEKDVTDLGYNFAYQKAFRTALEYIRNSNVVSLMTIVRTYSPAHFEHGSWFTGGYCNRTGPLSEEEVKLEGQDWELRNIQKEEIERLRDREGEGEGAGSGKKFRILDTTEAMLARADGHPDSHYNNRKGNGVHDCLHWCLPGPIDAWNELLLAVIQKEVGSIQS